MRDLAVINNHISKSNLSEETKKIKKNKIKQYVPEIEERLNKIEKEETINLIVKVNIEALKSCVRKLKS